MLSLLRARVAAPVVQLLPFLGSFPHTTQSLGHAPPALCRARMRLLGVLLGQRSSLRAGLELAISLPSVLPSAYMASGGALKNIFDAQYPACRCPCLRFV